MTFMRKEGKHTDLSNEVYHSDVHYFSSSQLKEALVSPSNFKYYVIERNGKNKTTKAMELGTLIHLVVLEIHKFDDEYIVVDGKTNIDGSLTKTSYDSHKFKSGRLEPISDAWYKLAVKARHRITSNPVYNALMYDDKCEYEPSYFLKDKETGLNLRVRPDCINLDKGYIVDLKSTADVSEHSFGYDAKVKYHYDMSAFMYQYVVYMLTGKVCDFYWACVGKEALTPVVFYKVSADTFEKAKGKFYRAIDNIKSAMLMDGDYELATEIKEL